MKSRPILFSAPMVRAILEGRKTQTRRIAKWPGCASLHGRSPIPGRSFVDTSFGDVYLHAAYGGGDLKDDYQTQRVFCPYGAPGDRLWVRETWAWSGDKRLADSDRVARGDVWFRADPQRDNPAIRWRPSIHMPRWASRLTLEITGVRAERLQSISEDDAKAEGVTPFPYDPEGDCWTDGKHRTAFEYLWGEINGWEGEPKARAPWGTNPFLWVIEFKRVAQEAQAAE